MRKTPPLKYRYDPLDPRGILCFLVLTVLWIFWGFLPENDHWLAHAAARLAGYAALAAMLVPYWHIAQRALRSQPGRRMSYWLRWHIAASYIGFAFLLVHCHARASSPLTLALLCLTWIVMLSGVAGFYGQKILYGMLPNLTGIPTEFGLERLEPERLRLYELAGEVVAKKEMAGATSVVQEFARAAVEGFLKSPFQFWKSGYRRSKEFGSDVEERDYRHAVLLAADTQRPIVEKLWELVENRRRLDYEYRFHQLGRIWLLFHGPAAWVLLILMLEHVWKSWRYGGF